MKYKKTTAFGIGCAALLFVASTTVFASTSEVPVKTPSSKIQEFSPTNKDISAAKSKASSVKVQEFSSTNKDKLNASSDEKENADSNDYKLTINTNSQEYPVHVTKKNSTLSLKIQDPDKDTQENASLIIEATEPEPNDQKTEIPYLIQYSTEKAPNNGTDK